MISFARATLSSTALRAVFAAAFVSIFASHPAFAQDPAADPAPVETPAADAATPEPYEETVPVTSTETAEAEPAPADSVKLDKVEVTGSRIKRTDYETAQPVAVINRADIERSGLTNIGDLLARITAAGTSINTTAGTIFLSGGETNLDLRNLGTNRVLILVNGRRWVNGLTSTSTDAVDLNTIPTAIIERVEVLKDGASAIYGSDAIAGVVNIITRKNFTGIDASSQWGRYEEGDGARQQHQISFGSTGRWTSLFADISFTKDDVVKTTHRSIASDGPGGKELGKTRWNGIGPEGRLVFIPNPATYALLGPDKCPLLTLGLTDPDVAGIPLCDISHTVGTDGTNPVTDFHRWDLNIDSYNRFVDSNLQNPNQRSAGFLQLNQRIFDSLSFEFQGLFNNNKAQSQLRPQALTAGDLVGEQSYVSRTNQYNPFPQDIGRGVGAVEFEGGFCGPDFPTPLLCDQLGPDALVGEGAILLRLVKFPPVLTKYFTNTMHLTGGFNGNFDVFEHYFNWDMGYAYSTNRKKEVRTGDYRKDRMLLALGPAADCTGDCVQMNVFNGQNGITQQMIDYLALKVTNYTRTRRDDAYFNFSTDLGIIRLPWADPISIALGVEWRRDQYNDNPDDILEQGLSSGNNSVATTGETTAKEAYAELGIPLVKDVLLLNSLDLSFAARVSNYKSFGTARTGKAGVRYKPYEDLLLRGTYSSAFRAPSVGELFLGDSDSFDQLIDPCSGEPTGNAQTNCSSEGVSGAPVSTAVTETRGGNPNLKPETARTATIGMVFSPSFIPDFNVTVDWYRIRLTDFITIAGGQFILDSCYTTDPDERAFCEFIHRNPNGSLDFIEDRYVNFSGLLTSGVDGTIDYRLPFPNEFGKFKIVLDASYLIQYDQTVPTAGGGETTDGYVGQTTGFTFLPRWKATGELVYKLGGFTASWATRMVYKTDESCVDFVPNLLAPGPTLREAGVCTNPRLEEGVDEDGNPTFTDVSRTVLPTHFYHDLQLGYEIAAWKTAVTIGVKNITQTEPPISRDPTTGGAYFNYNVLSEEIPGSFTYFKVSKKF